MKLGKKLIFTLLSLFLILTACTGGNKGKDQIDISGKTYYNTVDEYGNSEHSKVWFGKDGTFVMQDNFYDGYYQISGKWSLSENVVTLDVESTGVGDFQKIIFEVKDAETLILKTLLAGSKSDDVFSVNQVTDSGQNNTNPNPNPDPNNSSNLGPNTGMEGNFEAVTYYNASQSQKDKSFVKFYEDNSFSYTEVQGMGAVAITGLVGSEGTVLMFSNFDEPIYNYKGEALYNFEMEVYDEKTLILLTDIATSFAGDVFTTDGSMPADYVPPTTTVAPVTQWVHGPFPAGSEPAPNCEPRFTLYNDGSFVFIENVYAGMGQYKGWYEQTDTGFALHVTDASTMQGFAGQNVELIVLNYSGENTLTLKTDLCMSLSGHEFVLEK